MKTRPCKWCGKEFIIDRNSTRHSFCKRTHYRKWHYRNSGEKEQRYNEYHHLGPRPTRKCYKCGNESKLDFDPIFEPVKFTHWKCPICGDHETASELIYQS